MKRVSTPLGTGGILIALLLAACGGPEPVSLGEGEEPQCWVYKGLSEEEMARMEAWCNEYAVCTGEDGESCSGPTEAATQ